MCIRDRQQLRGEHWQWRDEVIGPDANLLADVSGETLEIMAEFAIDDLNEADRFGFRVRTGDDESTTIGYATKARTLYVDRAQSGDVAFSPGFGAAHTAAMEPVDGLIRLHGLVDSSAVEVFGNDGRVVFSERIFPAGDSLGLPLFLDGLSLIHI